MARYEDPIKKKERAKRYREGLSPERKQENKDYQKRRYASRPDLHYANLPEWKKEEIRLKVNTRQKNLSPEEKAHRNEVLKIWLADRPPEDVKKQRLYQQQWRDKAFQVPERRIRHLMIAARARAKRKGQEFDSDLLEHLLRIGVPTNCPCCKEPLDYATRQGRSRGRERTASLDRRINTVGYTKENTWIICYRCNRLKSDGTLEEFQNILQYASDASLGPVLRRTDTSFYTSDSAGLLRHMFESYQEPKQYTFAVVAGEI